MYFRPAKRTVPAKTKATPIPARIQALNPVRGNSLTLGVVLTTCPTVFVGWGAEVFAGSVLVVVVLDAQVVVVVLDGTVVVDDEVVVVLVVDDGVVVVVTDGTVVVGVGVETDGQSLADGSGSNLTVFSINT